MLNEYQLVQLKDGAYTVRSLADAETFHPVIGPVAEADALYIRQLRLLERLESSREEFVIWDVGLGAAANPLAFITAASALAKTLRIVSFDQTIQPLRFALQHPDKLEYLATYVDPLKQLTEEHHVSFHAAGQLSALSAHWELHLADFPAWLKTPSARAVCKPDAVFYDAFSPQKNPAMWTLEVFSDLFELLSPARACAMATYSRSTMLRVTLLLAGFFVGVGHATGEKEETTIAANNLTLIDQPLDRSWLGRVRRSRSAEPLHSPQYRQAPPTQETLEKLLQHPQFR